MTYDLPAFPGIPQINGRILINGEIREQGYERQPVFSTCTDDGKPQQIGTTPHVSADVLREAVEGASQAWAKGLGDWSTSRMEDRINAVIAFRNGMLEQRELICRLLMWEIGKNWADSQGEFDRTIQYIDDTVNEVKNMDREASRFQFSGGVMAQIRRAPLGVTLCMGPFNYPLNETFTTLIPALIMGNTVVVKLARYGQLLWEPLLEPFQKAFPKGVVNIINGLGREIVNPVVKDGKIDVLAFIGTSRVANQIKVSHPQPFRFRSILSLEAKNPAIILEDADLDNAVNECVRGALSFNGQRCTALKMIFVHKKISAEFTKKLVQKVNSMVPGMPWDKGVSITPLPDPEKPKYLQGLIDDAVAKGAKLANPEQGGKLKGNIFFPAILANVPLTARAAIEEQFGPVIPLAEYESFKEIEEYILNSPYGNQASVFGQDATNMGQMIDRLSNQVCRININSQCQRGPDVYPFTGRKNSAEGTLSVYDALRSFSIRCMVAAKQDQAGRKVIQGILHQDSSKFLSTNVVL
ncbi:aldehyde dehydrogenase family protein [Bdellovibrio sp. SKB1291214]|uniref:aldehyde dehydrogenase family protein n=1 Tax=Bdellovibrio sp. SKB1291214 TaxID=1732569 RepID=UPI000B51C83F|nr:aldehyde dehydrogenase family protein [Bdellovibrio sp. SKB1291214]UYL07798.1 aldehyde dehydrogenase family protein [Bdellovibrio sp. SKB1291214]